MRSRPGGDPHRTPSHTRKARPALNLSIFITPALSSPTLQAASRSTAAASSSATKEASTAATSSTAGKACLARSAPGWVETAAVRKQASASASPAAPPRNKEGLQSLFF